MISDYIITKSIGRSPSALNLTDRLYRPSTLIDSYKSMDRYYAMQRSKARLELHVSSTSNLKSNNAGTRHTFNLDTSEQKASLMTALNKMSFSLSKTDKELMKAKKSELSSIKKTIPRSVHTKNHEDFIVGHAHATTTTAKHSLPIKPRPVLPSVKPSTIKSLISPQTRDADAGHRQHRTSAIDCRPRFEATNQISAIDGDASTAARVREASHRCDLTVDRYFKQRVFGGDDLAMARLKRFQILKLGQANTLRHIVNERSAGRLSQMPGYLIERKFNRNRDMINNELEKIKVQKLVANQVFHDLKNFTIQA